MELIIMLILSRRPGETFYIVLAESVPHDLTVGELFADGPIQFTVLGVKGNQVRVGTEASDQLTILREELV